MKKVKPWMLTLGSLVVASATIATLATTFSAVAQEQYKISDNNQTRSSGLSAPRAIDNNTIKNDWKNYQKQTSKQAKVYAQHRFTQEMTYKGNGKGYWVSLLLNYSNSSKNFTSNDSVNNGQNVLNTFSYGKQNNNDFANAWRRIIRNALESVRSNGRLGRSNYTPLITYNGWSNNKNNGSNQFIKFDFDGEGQGDVFSTTTDAYWVDPTKPFDNSMVEKLNGIPIFGDISINKDSATHMLWGTERVGGEYIGMSQQRQIADFQTDKDDVWNNFFIQNFTAISNNYISSLQNQNQSFANQDDGLYYYETHFGLPADLNWDYSEQKDGVGTRLNSKVTSNIQIFDATNLSNNGNGPNITHKSKKYPMNVGPDTTYTQKDWFENRHEIYGYNQHMADPKPVLGNIGSTNNVAVTMDLDLTNLISVQALTNHKDNGDVNTMGGNQFLVLNWDETKLKCNNIKTKHYLQNILVH